MLLNKVGVFDSLQKARMQLATLKHLSKRVLEKTHYSTGTCARWGKVRGSGLCSGMDIIRKWGEFYDGVY